MAAIEQRVNSRKGRERRGAGSSRYGRTGGEATAGGWQSKSAKFWRRIFVVVGFCEKVVKLYFK
jgi:hypothetical protein